MLISIITINYNNKLGLERTIKSVQNQIFKNYEHIVIDGNSSDGGKKIIDKHKHFFSYWVSEPDTGIYNAMNKGIKASKGTYLMFLNSGDTLINDLVLDQVFNNLSSNYDIYYGDLLMQTSEYKKRLIFPEKLSFYYFINRGYIPHPSAFIKRTLFDDIYFYREDFKIVSDWDFFICAICKHNVTYKHLNLLITNFDTEGISNDPRHRKCALNEKKISLESNFPLFLEDTQRLIVLDKKFNLNRFKLLDALENSSLSQKMNSIWLTLLSKFFLKKKDLDIILSDENLNKNNTIIHKNLLDD